MYAIIKTSGKQYKVENGTTFDIDRVAQNPGDEIVLKDAVLLISNGDALTVGTPTVAGATVTLTVKEHIRGPKLIAFKMKRRKRSRVKKGHRQELTTVEVKDIALA